MRPEQIEDWVLRIVDRVHRGDPIEDDRVELKSSWIPASKAARRIAGHANASRGGPVLWIVGLDENVGVVGSEAREYSDWWAQIRAEFDGIPPECQIVNVPAHGKTLLGMLFDTVRAPFVVRNSVFGTPGGGPVQREVPWREGNATRSAKRSDLIRLLVPRTLAPSVEVLSASADVQRQEDEDGGWDRGSGRPTHPHCWWNLYVKLYVTPSSEERVVFPFHLCSAEISVEGLLERQPLEDFVAYASARFSSQGTRPASHTVAASPSEIIAHGPGVMDVRAGGFSELKELSTSARLCWWLSLGIANSEVPIHLNGEMEIHDDGTDRLRWRAI